MTESCQIIDLAAFSGSWLVTRRIIDQLGPPGQFTGLARFEPVADGLAYHEQGQLQLGEGPAFAAERRYLWRSDGPQIAVDFEDGRPFHSFDLAAPEVTARHDCAPDLYLVRYDFGLWPVWQVEWQVKGPRKHYRMLSFYRRSDDAGVVGKSPRFAPMQRFRVKPRDTV